MGVWWILHGGGEPNCLLGCFWQDWVGIADAMTLLKSRIWTFKNNTMFLSRSHAARHNVCMNTNIDLALLVE